MRTWLIDMYTHISKNPYNPHVWIQGEENLRIGKNCWIGAFVIIEAMNSTVTIGNNVTIASGVHIYTHDNAYRKIDGTRRVGSVVIGDNVFIGANSVILPGAHIGNNCVIGALSLVKGRIPANTMAAGVPARVLKSVHPINNKRNRRSHDNDQNNSQS